MKKLKWIAVAIVLLVVVGVLVVLKNIDAIVRTAVETQSTASLGLATKLGGANVSLFGGSVKLSDFAVSSPEGFSSLTLMDLGSLGLNVSVGELRSEPVRISSIILSKPKLVLEQKDFKLNLKAAMDQMPKRDPAAEPVKVVIGEIRLEEPVVVVKPGIPGMSEEITVALPSMSVKDIGTGPGAQNGVAIKEVILKLATEMAAAASDSEKLPPEVRTILKGDISNLRAQLGGMVEKQLEQVTEKARGAASQAVEDAQKSVEKGIGDLLKKKPK